MPPMEGAACVARDNENLLDLQQRTHSWHEARLGCVTASRIADVTARTKSGYGAARQTYMRQLMAERISGMPTETVASPAMRWGTQVEPYAVAAYEELTQTETLPVSFIRHPDIEFAGASPDRLIAEDGLLEVKCPTTPTHIDTLLSGEIAERYVLQMQWQMACTGRSWCDFVSFDPRLPPHYQYFVTRTERNDAVIARLEAEAASFLIEIEHRLEALVAARTTLPSGL